MVPSSDIYYAVISQFFILKIRSLSLQHEMFNRQIILNYLNQNLIIVDTLLGESDVSSYLQKWNAGQTQYDVPTLSHSKIGTLFWVFQNDFRAGSNARSNISVSCPKNRKKNRRKVHLRNSREKFRTKDAEEHQNPLCNFDINNEVLFGDGYKNNRKQIWWVCEKCL